MKTNQEIIQDIENQIAEYKELLEANDGENIVSDVLYTFAIERLQNQIKKIKKQARKTKKAA